MIRICLVRTCLFLVGVFTASVAVGQAVNQSPTQPQTPSQAERPTTQNQPAGQGDASAAQRAKVTDLFISELDELMPGDVKPGSQLDQDLRRVVSSFLGGKVADAKALLEQLKNKYALMPPADLMIAGMYFSANGTERGFQLLESVAQTTPDYPGTYLAFGRMALNQSRFTDARALLEKAGRVFQAGSFAPEEKLHFQTQYYEALALVSIRQKRLEDATRLAEQFESLAPTSQKAMAVNAEVAFQNGDVQKSMAYLSKLRQAKPNTRIPELVIATWYGQKNDAAEVEKWVTVAQKKYPEDAAVQTEFASWALNLEKFEQAEAALEKAIASKPTAAASLIRARLLFAKGEYGAAETEFENLFKGQQGNFDIGNMYAMSLVESPFDEKKKLAQKIAERNFRSLPNNQIAQAALGWVYYQMGDSDKARQLLARSAQANQMPPEVAYFLSKFLHDMGDSAKAVTLLETALKRKGLYLYRKPATALLNEAKAQVASGSQKQGGNLPGPGK